MDEASLGTGGFTVTRTDDGTLGSAMNVFVRYAGSASYGSGFSTANLFPWNGDVFYMTIPAGEFSISALSNWKLPTASA